MTQTQIYTQKRAQRQKLGSRAQKFTVLIDQAPRTNFQPEIVLCNLHAGCRSRSETVHLQSAFLAGGRVQQYCFLQLRLEIKTSQFHVCYGFGQFFQLFTHLSLRNRHIYHCPAFPSDATRISVLFLSSFMLLKSSPRIYFYFPTCCRLSVPCPTFWGNPISDVIARISQGDGAPSGRRILRMKIFVAEIFFQQKKLETFLASLFPFIAAHASMPDFIFLFPAIFFFPFSEKGTQGHLVFSQRRSHA